MSIKKTASNARDSLQKGIYVVINPVVRGLIRCGFTPNMVTTVGFLGNVAAAVVFAYAGVLASKGVTDFSLITIGGALIIGFSLFDMLDGQVARLGGMTSRFGAMYDSVLDRYCELFTLGGIAYFLLGCGCLAGGLITFLALVGSIMVSYIRARAEGIGLECKIGFMQRPERVVVTSLAAIATGICGQCGVDFDPNLVLVCAMAFIAVFANLTAMARISYSRKQLEQGK